MSLTNCIKSFLKSYRGDPLKIKKSDIAGYLNKFKKDFSVSTINLNLYALKFLRKEILHKGKSFYNIWFSKTLKSLPEVLTKDEVVRLITSIKNKKQQLMVKLMYSSGLRVGELVNLRVMDFEFW